MFNGPLMILGFSLIPFFVMLPETTRCRRPAMIFAALAGLLSALGLIGLTGTPVDDDTHFHNAMLLIWMPGTPVMTICCLIATITGKTASKWAGLASMLIGSVFAGWQIQFPPASPEIWQRAGVCAAITWFVVISGLVLQSAWSLLHPSEAVVRRIAEARYFD